MVKDDKGRVLKVGIIIYTEDPVGHIRYLLRHNKPFDGYEDEWTLAFGTIEDGESLLEAGKREGFEEYGIKDLADGMELDHEVEYTGKRGLSVIHFAAYKAPNLDVKVVLNEESIGYDWMLFDDVMKTMKYDDEKEAIKIVDENIRRK